LIYQYFFDYEVFEFYGYNHRVILLLVYALEVYVGKCYGRHSTTSMRVSYDIDKLNTSKVSFSSGWGWSSSWETARYGIDNGA